MGKPTFVGSRTSALLKTDEVTAFVEGTLKIIHEASEGADYDSGYREGQFQCQYSEHVTHPGHVVKTHGSRLGFAGHASCCYMGSEAVVNSYERINKRVQLESVT